MLTISCLQDSFAFPFNLDKCEKQIAFFQKLPDGTNLLIRFGLVLWMTQTTFTIYLITKLSK